VSGDLRLAIAAGTAWLSLALCLDASMTTTVVVCCGALAVGLAVLLAVPGTTWARVAFPVGAAAWCVLLVLVPFAGRLWLARDSPLQQLAREHAAAVVEATVTGDPHPLAATGIAGAPRVAVDTAVELVQSGRELRSASGPLLVLAPATGWSDVLPGQRVRIEGQLQPSLDAGSTGATLFADHPPRLVGRPPWWQRAAGVVRTGLRAAAAGLGPDVRGLLPGLVDGDTSGIDPVLIERFRVAGLTHLVAVSGTNCSIVVGAVLLVLRRARMRPWLCAGVGAVVLVGFVIVARPSPSVLRAALMAAVALVSLATGRPRQAIPALSATVLALLVWDPQLGTDPGFVMSALATAALLLLAPGWAAALRRRHVPPVVAESLAVATAAHVVTAPVIAALSGRISLVAIPANVLAEPAVPVATLLGFGAAMLAPAWLTGAHQLAWLAGWPCRWLAKVADVAGGLPGATLAWPGGAPGGLALLAASVLLLALAGRSRTVRGLLAASVVTLLVRIPVTSLATDWPPPGWAMVACDVGQGDALVLAAGAHTAVEVDAGPDPVAVDRCLRDLGVSDVPLLVFTHYHLDHVGGLAGVLHRRTVEHVVTGPLAEPAGGVELVHGLMQPRGVPVTVPPVGASYDVGAVHLQVLGPPGSFHDTRSDPNNSSLVLRASVGGVRILLPGDVEVEAQQAMLAAGVDVRADVLKVPHHGSAYSDPRFLAAVHARVGVISVGLHNDYGHPSPVLLSELAQLGVPVRRTDEDGDVAVVAASTGAATGLTTVVRGVASSTAALGPVASSGGAPPLRAGPQAPRAPAAVRTRTAGGPRRPEPTRISCGPCVPCRTGTGRGPPSTRPAGRRAATRRTRRPRTRPAPSAARPKRRDRRR
jgi:competence protein ComEC